MHIIYHDTIVTFELSFLLSWTTTAECAAIDGVITANTSVFLALLAFFVDS